MIQLGALENAVLCAGGGVSDDGNVIVGTCLTTAGNSAFRWTEGGGMVSLGQFGDGSNRTSNAIAIATDAKTIVGTGHPALTEAVLWRSADEVHILGWFPGDISGVATSVSSDGAIVVGYSTEPTLHQRAFRWSAQSGILPLASADRIFSDSIATAVSGNGKVIVGWGVTLNGEAAWIWDEVHGMRLIVDMLRADSKTLIPGWMLSRATGISDNGATIVGAGINPDGQSEGWVLTLLTP
jgi:probable HAF family extracellular repeat protein